MNAYENELILSCWLSEFKMIDLSLENLNLHSRIGRCQCVVNTVPLCPSFILFQQV